MPIPWPRFGHVLALAHAQPLPTLYQRFAKTVNTTYQRFANTVKPSYQRFAALRCHALPCQARAMALS